MKMDDVSRGGLEGKRDGIRKSLWVALRAEVGGEGILQTGGRDGARTVEGESGRGDAAKGGRREAGTGAARGARRKAEGDCM